MSGNPNAVRSASSGNGSTSRQTARRSATRAEILDAAWDVVRERGLAALSMRELGARVGMRAQSLYSYFASKDEIYDAMFRQGYEEYLHDSRAAAGAADPRERLRKHAHQHFAFCTADPVRFQLLFQRTVPGFAPSPQSYALAVQSLAEIEASMREAGIEDLEVLDLSTAMLAGLTNQQIANDPGGNRWERLVDRAVDGLLLMAATPPRRKSRSSKESKRL